MRQKKKIPQTTKYFFFDKYLKPQSIKTINSSTQKDEIYQSCKHSLAIIDKLYKLIQPIKHDNNELKNNLPQTTE